MKHEFWTVAFRKRSGNGTLLDNKTSPFHIIPNTWRYWSGDPHLLSYQGKTFVFAELYDRILRRGVIGYCELNGETASPWKVALTLPYHLSYPHILQEGNAVHMIPESYCNAEIAWFTASHFPDKWVKTDIIKSDWVSVDSTVFEHDDHTWMFTMRLDQEREDLYLFLFDNCRLSDHGLRIYENNRNSRPAGRLFRKDGKLIRPAQDCSESYGCALNFYEIKALSLERYDEVLIDKIHPSDIVVDSPISAAGIHTYNFNEEYEVIDLKTYQFDIWAWIMRPIWFIHRRAKRLFGR